MQTDNELRSLLLTLINHAQEMIDLWQIAVLVVSMGLAWLMQRRLVKRMAEA